MQLDDLQALASVLSAVCAVIAAGVSVLVWRKARADDLSEKIDDGDARTRKQTDRSIAAVKNELDQLNHRVSDMEDGVARIEVSQGHHLAAKDLGPIHDKINRVAEQLAANTATTNAMREQLRVIQTHLMRERP